MKNSGNANVTKKQCWILKANWYIVLLSISLVFVSVAQTDASKPSLNDFRRELILKKEKNYSGPDYFVVEEDPERLNPTGEGSDENPGINLSDEEIRQIRKSGKKSNRNNRFGENRRGSAETEIRENPKSRESISLPAGFGTGILVVLGLVLLAVIVYFLAKKQWKKGVPTIQNYDSDEWNPEVIPKTELELRLEEAKRNGDFRSCIRIYFTFILKENMRLNYIRWKKDYTNYDYVTQLRNHLDEAEFSRLVSIYDWVWYGEYQLTENEFLALEKDIEAYYKRLAQIQNYV